MAGSILEVELIEDAMSPVGGKGVPVGALEGAALCKEAHEVGFGGEGLGGEEAGPRSKTAGNGGRSRGRWGRRGIRGSRGRWEIRIYGEYGRLLRGTREAIVDIIAADSIFAIAYGDNIYTFARSEGDIPIILGHTGDDIIMRQMPTRADV